MITVADMVRTERAFLDALGIERLAAVAGGSLGGMQALEWAILYPDQVDAIVAIASTHALQPAGHGLERDRPRVDHARPGWQGGHYYATGRTRGRRDGRGPDGRPRHVPVRPGARPTSSAGGCRSRDDIRFTITEPEFEVESYLRHQADSFVKRFDANTYLYTSRALTYFDLARQYGGGSLVRGARSRLGAYAADRVQL